MVSKVQTQAGSDPNFVLHNKLAICLKQWVIVTEYVVKHDGYPSTLFHHNTVRPGITPSKADSSSTQALKAV